MYLRDRGDTEIGGFGISAADDPLRIVDFRTVRQRATMVTVALDDGAVADLFDELVDRGLRPEQFGRVWVHSHPGRCPLPSPVDEETFRRAFGRNEWSVMAIVARNDATYARLAFRVGPGGAVRIPVRVDYGQAFGGADAPTWDAEYAAHVQVPPPALPTAAETSGDFWEEEQSRHYWDWEEFYGGELGAGSV